MIVLDTNVVSEPFRKIPSAALMDWMRRQPAETLYLSTVSMGELLAGLRMMTAGRRRDTFAARLDLVLREDFSGRILPFDAAAATEYAEIRATRRAAGRGLAPYDEQIAAIARSRGMAVATRDSNGFADCGITVINPWEPKEVSP